MLEALFKALEAGLSIWKSENSRKYLDKLISLKRDWYAEYNKPDNERDLAVLDNLEFELRLISSAFYTEAGTANTGAKPK